MKIIILKAIKIFRQFFIGVQIVSLMTVIVISNKLLSKNSFDTYAYSDYSKRGYLELYGNVKEAKHWEVWPLKNIEGAEIVILNKEYEVIGNLHSDKEGLSFIKLPLNDQFILKVSKIGYITKTINVDTRGCKKKSASYYINFEIYMFEDIPGIDVNILTKPVANVRYNNYLSCFDYDFKVTDAINEKLKRKYLVYYRRHPESKVLETNNSGIIKNTPGGNINRSNYQNNKKTNSSRKNYFEFGKGANGKTNYRSLNDTIYNNSTVKNESVKIADTTTLVKADSVDVLFKIQISSMDEYLTPGAKFSKKFGRVNEYIHNGKHRYTIGEFKTFETASKTLNEINNDGYKDAFLVAFFKGQRISMDKALSIKHVHK